MCQDEIKLNLDTVRAAGNFDKLMEKVKKEEMLAVSEERFEDAIKWRDFPEHGIVNIYLDEFNNWKLY